MKNLKNNNLGFTLIEMIVSLGVFSIVVTTAVGAMLVLISTNQQLQAEQSVMTNLSFALDTMTREIRTGYNYYCASSLTDSSTVFIGGGHESLGENTRDCASGRNGSLRQGISFYEGGNSLSGDDKRILYYYDSFAKTIWRRVGDGTAQTIVSSGLEISEMQFYVSGSDDLDDGNTAQPTVTIYIEAVEKASADSKVYYLQTTVTQRILDL